MKRFELLARPLRVGHRGIHKVASLLPVLGLRGTAMALRPNVFAVERAVRVRKDLSTPEAQFTPKVPLIIKAVHKGDIGLDVSADMEKIRSIRGQYGLDQFHARLAAGDVLFVAHSLSEFVGFEWLQLPPVRDAGCRLADNEAYAYDAYAFAEARGKGIHPALIRAIFGYLRGVHPEVRWCSGYIFAANTASLVGAQRAGYSVDRLELSVCILGWHHRFVLRPRERNTPALKSTS